MTPSIHIEMDGGVYRLFDIHHRLFFAMKLTAKDKEKSHA
jgi:hypothetical protein